MGFKNNPLEKNTTIEFKEGKLLKDVHDSELKLVKILEKIHGLMREQHALQRELLTIIDPEEHAEKLAQKIKFDEQISHLIKEHKDLLKSVFKENKRLLKLIDKEETIDYIEFKEEMDKIHKDEKEEFLDAA